MIWHGSYGLVDVPFVNDAMHENISASLPILFVTSDFVGGLALPVAAAAGDDDEDHRSRFAFAALRSMSTFLKCSAFLSFFLGVFLAQSAAGISGGRKEPLGGL